MRLAIEIDLALWGMIICASINAAGSFPRIAAGGHMFGICKWIRRLTALVFVVAGSTLTFAGPAGAFSPGDCNDVSSSGTVSGFNTFNVDAGKADFGDHPHWGGAPRGDAVICWFSNGRVGVEGTLFADSLSGEPVSATAEVRYRRTNGQFVTRSFGIGTNISWVASGRVIDLSPSGNFDRVRIRLFTFLPDTPNVPRVRVFSKTFLR
jgi:hypothetical protein